MPAPWTSSLPQWTSQTQATTHQHPPPGPASSTYSPFPAHNLNPDANNVSTRSSALRPFSGFFNRFTTPRLGARPHEAPDVPPIPVPINANANAHNVPSPVTPWPDAQRGQHYGDGDLYEAASGRPASVVEDMRVPEGLFGRRGGLQPPAPVHTAPRSAVAANTGGDLPIAFSPSEIGVASPNPNLTTTDNPNPGPAPPSRPRRHRRHKHRRHRGAHHTHKPTHARLNSTSTSHSLAKSTQTTPRRALSDPRIKLKLLHTLISGALFLITLIVFLAINPLTPVFSPPFRIVNSLLIVFFAIIFVHSGIRLNSLILDHRRRMRRMVRKREREVEREKGLGSVDLGTGTEERQGVEGGRGAEGVAAGRARVQYFDDPEIGLPPPGEPIRVVLARDEEIGVNDDLVAEDEHVAGGNGVGDAANLSRHDPTSGSAVAEDELHSGNESAAAAAARVQGTPKPPPPVYGVWRGSVRADPNLLHWQRVEREGFGGDRASGREGGSESEGDGEGLRDFAGHSRPPPSYVTQEMRSGGGGGGLETLPATRYVI